MLKCHADAWSLRASHLSKALCFRGNMSHIDSSNLYEELAQFEQLPGLIDKVSVESFQSVYGSIEASKAKGIVYIYMTEKPIPRLVGKSRVLYIGKTDTSFKKRRSPDAKLHATSKANKLKYSAVLSEYGPVSVLVADFKRYGDTSLQAEGQLLWWYFQNHCEYPPFNYTKTKVRTDKVQT